MLLDSIERMRVSDDVSFASDALLNWETLNVATPRLVDFMMVPISTNEILFLGGDKV